jgi:hypothetical protein
MAKLLMPLMSGSASGQFAHSIVYDKRGYARKYVIPTNPKTTAQGDVRIILASIQEIIKHLNTATRQSLRATHGYRWNSVLIGLVIGKDQTAWSATHTTWDAAQPADRTAATDYAAQYCTQPGLGYQTEAIELGMAAFAVLHAIGTVSTVTAVATSNVLE